MTVPQLAPGMICRTDGGANYYLVMPQGACPTGWITVLQIKGPNLKEGEALLRTGGRIIGVLGKDFEVVHDMEYRMVSRDGKLRGLLMKREAT